MVELWLPPPRGTTCMGNVAFVELVELVDLGTCTMGSVVLERCLSSLDGLGLRCGGRLLID